MSIINVALGLENKVRTLQERIDILEEQLKVALKDKTYSEHPEGVEQHNTPSAINLEELEDIIRSELNKAMLNSGIKANITSKSQTANTPVIPEIHFSDTINIKLDE